MGSPGDDSGLPVGVGEALGVAVALIVGPPVRLEPPPPPPQPASSVRDTAIPSATILTRVDRRCMAVDAPSRDQN